jgi:hypothetical protein
MSFGLKNIGTMYQRAMNMIFHDLIGKKLEVYVDDIVIKSNEFREHMDELQKAFDRMKKFNLKMNPLKYTFGVLTGHFLGCFIHDKGIKIERNKA